MHTTHDPFQCLPPLEIPTNNLGFSPSLQPDVIGNKTEGALLILLAKLHKTSHACDYQTLRGTAQTNVVARRTFNSKNKFMSVLLKDPGQDVFFVYCKG